jgi:hypothetical protein
MEPVEPVRNSIKIDIDSCKRKCYHSEEKPKSWDEWTELYSLHESELADASWIERYYFAPRS